MNQTTTNRSIQPYLFFDGRCEEAIEFYRKALGAELEMLMRFKENPEPSTNPPGSEDKVMHAAFRIGETQVLASDGHCAGKSAFQGFALSVTARNPEEADKMFHALSEGGNILMPLTATFFSPRFGMVADKFGVSWMVIVPKVG